MEAALIATGPTPAPRPAPPLDGWLLAVVVACGWLRVVHLGAPEGSLIFDEAYYVQSARVLLGWPVLSNHLPVHVFAGIDPNAEHPPLAKLIMAGSMLLLGNRGIAWRLPSVLFGLLAIVLVYRLALAAGGTRRQARLAAFVLGFDNLAFVHGRIATLDVYVMSFIVLGAWLYLIDRAELSALAFGLATLCKLNGVFGVVAMAFYEGGLFLRGGKRLDLAALRPLVTLALIYTAFTLCALGALDALFTSFPDPLSHLAHIVKYGAALKRDFALHGSPAGIDSSPLQWWLNDAPINYLVVHEQVHGHLSDGGHDLTRTTVLFRGALTEFVIFAAPFSLLFAALRGWRGSRFGVLCVALFAANYLPVFCAWLLASRISYIYYMLPSLPAIALAIAFSVSELPQPMRICFLCAMLYSTAMWFPFRWH